MAEWTFYFKYTLAKTTSVDNSIRGCSNERPFTIDYKPTILDRKALMLTVTSLEVKIPSFLFMLVSPNVALLLKLNASG